ncbi:E3 ubiquitin-protein ligase UBR7 [Sporothrix schenckii 1099-18]|uniref:E3 ubiquitin-protein ligase UBR7 n=1 Tax=Sporothrix schenckii 1099-18 TaxID=1397361 RepID=A0A0F2MES8_SPOSC|nr:E3 ubiquitin-protein ligase UBR7 [Sporothrix schenckii 1099-18]KJR86666.1 E3 ubiquitin-protein ligase UBR7 [Sporothrix schenckii 1099-18]
MIAFSPTTARPVSVTPVPYSAMVNISVVHSEEPDRGNKYNQNFRNRFCGCALDYDPFQQRGTMFQCLGLGTHDTGGCGEDWWHPGCIVGLGLKESETYQERGPEVSKVTHKDEEAPARGVTDCLPTISETVEYDEHVTEAVHSSGGARAVEGDGCGDREEEGEDDPPMPPGFPNEDAFEGFICYKCVDAYPWIRQYAGSPGFLPAVLYRTEQDVSPAQAPGPSTEGLVKRKADDDTETGAKRFRTDDKAVADEDASTNIEKDETVSTMEPTVLAPVVPTCKKATLPPPPSGRFSLFFTEDFRDHLCRCANCFPLLTAHPQLLEQEETYEPPVSDDGGSNAEGVGPGSGSHGSGSLYERGESALRNVDRVRAIEGVMAYNHLKDKLKPFFQQFAESGQAISAEDIKSYFAKLRGDEQAIQEAGEGARSDDNWREQSGY